MSPELGRTSPGKEHTPARATPALVLAALPPEAGYSALKGAVLFLCFVSSPLTRSVAP